MFIKCLVTSFQIWRLIIDIFHGIQFELEKSSASLQHSIAQPLLRQTAKDSLHLHFIPVWLAGQIMELSLKSNCDYMCNCSFRPSESCRHGGLHYTEMIFIRFRGSRTQIGTYTCAASSNAHKCLPLLPPGSISSRRSLKSVRNGPLCFHD